MEAREAEDKEERFTITVRLVKKELDSYTRTAKELNLKLYEFLKLAVILLLKIAGQIKSGGSIILLDAHGNMEKLCILELDRLPKEKPEGGE